MWSIQDDRLAWMIAPAGNGSWVAPVRPGSQPRGRCVSSALISLLDMRSRYRVAGSCPETRIHDIVGRAASPCGRGEGASGPAMRAAGSRLHEGRMGRGHELDELVAGGHLLEKHAEYGAGHQAGLVRAHAARGHAQVQALDVYRRALALEVLVQDGAQ